MTVKIGAAAAAATLAIGGALAVQMASGADPALGPKAQKAASATTGSTGQSGQSSQTDGSDTSSLVQSSTSSPDSSMLPSQSQPAPVTTQAS